MVCGVVGARVAGAQQRGEHLSPAGHRQRMMAEAALVVAGRALPLAVSADQERVEVQDHLDRCGTGPPRTLARDRPRLTDRVKLPGPDLGTDGETVPPGVGWLGPIAWLASRGPRGDPSPELSRRLVDDTVPRGLPNQATDAEQKV